MKAKSAAYKKPLLSHTFQTHTHTHTPEETQKEAREKMEKVMIENAEFDFDLIPIKPD